MALFCIGDIHGKFTELAEVLRTLPVGAQIVCVGDIGLGFLDSRTPDCLAVVDHVAHERSQSVTLMRGNHDDPAIWQKQRFDWNAKLKNVRIPADVHRMKVGNIHLIMVGGGTSLDRSHPERINGHNWWEGEGVDPTAPEQVQRMVDAYGRADILITHVGPIEAKPGLEHDLVTFEYYSKLDPNLKQDVLDERELITQIFTISNARTIAFGHYHISLESHQGPLRYRCCNELEAWEYVKRSVLPPLPAG